MRNLDIAQLRALLAIEHYGGVSHAAKMLHLTQSAVSMQIKRLEESLGAELFSREGRKLSLTPMGEMVNQYARKMVAMNDELVARISAPEMVEELSFGVPLDIVEPYVLKIMDAFRKRYPDVRVNLRFGHSFELLKDFADGLIDLLITTEQQGKGALIRRVPLIWYGKEGGQAHLQRPLVIANHETCAFKPPTIATLRAADIDFEYYPDIQNIEVESVLVQSDLAVTAAIEDSNEIKGLVPIQDVALPPLPDVGIYLYKNQERASPPLNDLVEIAEKNYGE